MTEERKLLPCCGYHETGAVKWNEYNGVVQCHNCGQVYTALLAAPAPEPVALDIALNVKHKDCHKAADAFWQYWRENGVPHRHGYYESTWGAINQALRYVGVVPHEYGKPRIDVKGTTYLEDCIRATPPAQDTRRLVVAAKKLSLMAQTTGGTAGPDAGLMAAIDDVERALAAQHPEPASQWVRCAERLPDEGKTVIVKRGIAYRSGIKWYSLTGCDYPGKQIQWEVTHWQPLPPLPEDKQ